VAELTFYILSALAVLAAAGVILAKSPLVSVLSLLAAFFCLAGIFLLSGFQFVAAVQVLVYAGAILVLFLFVIMLLNLGDSRVEFHFQDTLPGARTRIALALCGVLGLIGAVAARRTPLPSVDPIAHEQGIDGLEGIALQLFGRYALVFEAASLLLLAAMVAVITLAKRELRGGAASDRKEAA
jgi:NADH-quinone oxidoreductase subunit J